MIRGQKRALKNEVLHIQKEVKFSIHNRFDVEVIDATTGKVKQKAFAENIVLDALWTRLLAPNTYFNYIHYGTGTGTLAASRTSLFTFLGAKAVGSKTLTYNWANGWLSSRKQCQITETENVGSEFKEVGIGYGSASGNLVTHALLKDMNGNEITIIKKSTDIINIYATVFVYWVAAGFDNSAIKIFPCRGNTLIEQYLVGDATLLSPKLLYFKGYPNYTYPSKSSSSNPWGCVGGKDVTLTYSVANKKISMSTIRAGASELNPSETGIKSLAFATRYGGDQWLPNISFYVPATFCAQSSITGEAIGTGDGNAKDFKTDFPFVKVGTKIYVNGTEQASGVSIDTNKPLLNTNLGAYFIFIESNFTAPGSNAAMPNFDSMSVVNTIEACYSIWYNPNYQYGIKSLARYYVTIEVSDDLVTWYTITGTSIPAEHQNRKYWKVTTLSNSFTCMALTSDFDTNNIHFTAAPASGAVITADYASEVIAKDSYHVYDFSFEIQLAEKTT